MSDYNGARKARNGQPFANKPAIPMPSNNKVSESEHAKPGGRSTNSTRTNMTKPVSKDAPGSLLYDMMNSPEVLL